MQVHSCQCSLLSMDSCMLTLNVGGSPFCTLRETLLREPSSRIALLVRGILPASRDACGNMFIDRDPRYFQVILNYLRDGWALLPNSPAERRELLQEARNFQVRVHCASWCLGKCS